MKENWKSMGNSTPYIERFPKPPKSEHTTHSELLNVIFHLSTALTTATKIIRNLHESNTRLLAAHTQNGSVNQNIEGESAKESTTGSAGHLPDASSRIQTINQRCGEYGKPTSLADII
jgi:hypothetical protein